jgi:Amt family ammonium transporter
MTPASNTIGDQSLALAFGLLLLAPLAIAGVALINTGLGRARSAAQSLLGSLMIAAIAAIAFALVGSAIAGPGAHAFVIAGKSWDVFGAGRLFLMGFTSSKPEAQLGLLFELFAVAFAAVIPWGSGADRWRLAAGCAAAALTGALIFPLAAHWVWGSGWLAALGANFAPVAGFVDGGGASAVHALGGLSALAVVWIAGPRRGKFPKEGLSTALPGHHAVYVLFGCLLALAGFLAWNVSGAILWLHAPLGSLITAAVNTLLSACAAVAATYAVTAFRFGKPDASLCANGWLAGLVASSAGAALIPPAAALAVGAVAGIATPLLVELLELALSIDDPSGAISVHAAGGLWGIFAAGLFAPQKGQLLAQVIGIAALLGVFLPLAYLVYALLNRVIKFRVDADGERLGMDLEELGGSAYPEFVIHRDESYR